MVQETSTLTGFNLPVQHVTVDLSTNNATSHVSWLRECNQPASRTHQIPLNKQNERALFVQRSQTARSFMAAFNGKEILGKGKHRQLGKSVHFYNRTEALFVNVLNAFGDADSCHEDGTHGWNATKREDAKMCTELSSKAFESCCCRTVKRQTAPDCRLQHAISVSRSPCSWRHAADLSAVRQPTVCTVVHSAIAEESACSMIRGKIE